MRILNIKHTKFFLLYFIIFIFLSLNIFANSIFSTGDSLYLEGNIKKAIEFYQNLSIATHDTLFNDIRRKINYLKIIDNAGYLKDSIIYFENLNDLKIENFKRLFNYQPNQDIREILYYKIAFLSLEIQDTLFALDYLSMCETKEYILKAAELALEKKDLIAYDLLNKIIVLYPNSVESELAREYLKIF